MLTFVNLLIGDQKMTYRMRKTNPAIQSPQKKKTVEDLRVSNHHTLTPSSRANLIHFIFWANTERALCKKKE